MQRERVIGTFGYRNCKIQYGTKGVYLIINAPSSGSDQVILTEVVVLIEMKFIVDAPHTELLIIRPAGIPVQTHTHKVCNICLTACRTFKLTKTLPSSETEL